MGEKLYIFILSVFVIVILFKLIFWFIDYLDGE